VCSAYKHRCVKNTCACRGDVLLLVQNARSALCFTNTVFLAFGSISVQLPRKTGIFV